MKRPYRGWINQPSTIQPLHQLHGKPCIVFELEGDGPFVDVFFTEGDTFSVRVQRQYISKGSNTHNVKTGDQP